MSSSDEFEVKMQSKQYKVLSCGSVTFFLVIQEANPNPIVLSESEESVPDCDAPIQRTLKRVDSILCDLVSL